MVDVSARVKARVGDMMEMEAGVVGLDVLLVVEGREEMGELTTEDEPYDLVGLDLFDFGGDGH